MSDTYQDKRIRLVQLIATLANIEKPLLDLGQVFDLAMKGEVHLYVRLPPDKVAYVDELLPIVIHRRSSMYFMDMGDFTRYSPLSHQIHPEVTHVAIDPDQAGELKTKRLTSDMAFASGLSLHPESMLAQEGWWVPCQFGASLVICPAPPESEAEKKRQRVRRNVLETTPEDVYVDERITALLECPHASIDDDPYYLRNRAPGVYVLYRAAANFYEPLNKAKNHEETTRIKSDIKLSLGRKVPKLYTETNAAQAVKLINPRSRRGSGLSPELKKTFKPFDVDRLTKPDFKLTYMQGSFVTDALALILYTTDWWRNECAKHEAAKAENKDVVAKRPPLKHLVEKLEELGFYGKDELKAVARIVMWPNHRG